MPTFQTTLYDRIDAVPLDDWMSVCRLDENPFLDPRFLRAVERGLAGECQLWHAILRTDDGRAVAAATFSRYSVDGAIFAPSGVRKWIDSIRRWQPGFFRFKLLLCGTPVSTGRSQLAVAAGTSHNDVLPELHRVATDLARRCGAVLITWKEFDPSTVDAMSGMHRLGYRRSLTVCSYSLASRFSTFEEYYEARSKRTRANIRKTFGRGDAAGLRVEHVPGGVDVPSRYTPEMHRLYLNVAERAKVKFEMLPAEFFRELARQYGDDARYTFVYVGEKPVAFCCALHTPGRYNMLYCGVDYDLNKTAEVYFNMMYRSLGHGFARDVHTLHVGASADEFKQHLGCVGTQLSMFVRGRTAFANWVIGKLFGVLFDAPKPATQTQSSSSVMGPTQVPGGVRPVPETASRT
jgi:predicted N-acyltransferase